MSALQIVTCALATLGAIVLICFLVGVISDKRDVNRYNKNAKARQKAEQRQHEIKIAVSEVLSAQFKPLLQAALSETKFYVDHKTQETKKFEKNKVADCYPSYGKKAGVNIRFFEQYKQPSVVCASVGTASETVSVSNADTVPVNAVNNGPAT